MNFKPREGQESIALSAFDKIVVYALVTIGFQHKRIADLYDVNQGRIPEAVKDVEEFLGRGE